MSEIATITRAWINNRDHFILSFDVMLPNGMKTTFCIYDDEAQSLYDSCKQNLTRLVGIKVHVNKIKEKPATIWEYKGFAQYVDWTARGIQKPQDAGKPKHYINPFINPRLIVST